LKNHLAYTLSKYAMTLCTLGMAAEFAEQGIAINSLWPRTTIATAAIEFNFSKKMLEACRHPEIVSDAVLTILSKPAKTYTGQCLIDEDVLRAGGKEDFSEYAVNPNVPLYVDLFISDTSENAQGTFT